MNLEFLLYDVTSTDFELQAEGNEKAARGHSRDHRGDCKHVCTPEGLPLNIEVFAGNRTDVTTVGDRVRKMEERSAHGTETDLAKRWRRTSGRRRRRRSGRRKSDMGLGPDFHQKGERVDAHLLVCFLSLALWRALETWMRSRGLGTSARKLVEADGTITPDGRERAGEARGP